MVPVFLLATLSHTPYPPHAPSLRLGLSLGFPSPTLYPRPSELGPRVERKGTEGTRREHQRTERRRVESGIMVDLSQAFPILVSWPVLYLPLHTSRPFLIPLVTLGSLLSPRYLIPRHFSIPSHSPSSRFRPEGVTERRETARGREKIPREGEFTLRTDPWAGLIASIGSFYLMVYPLPHSSHSPSARRASGSWRNGGWGWTERDGARHDGARPGDKNPKGNKESWKSREMS